ncbi:hypothetical protein AGMMS49975_17310 [Clostridia bacterium]|nr:hypothetical protein AGMMS49975_17310 [Clostridia bacterium]
MREMNFFSDYVIGIYRAKRENTYTILGFVGFILILGAGYLFFLNIQNDVNNQILDLDQQLANPVFVQARQQLAEEEQKLEATTNYLIALGETDKRFEEIHNYTSADNTRFLEAMPAGTTITEIRVKGSNITLTGYCGNREFIPAVVENLEQTGLFQRVVVSEITFDNNAQYNFTVNCVLVAEGGVSK